MEIAKVNMQWLVYYRLDQFWGYWKHAKCFLLLEHSYEIIKSAACLNQIHDHIGSYIASEYDAKQECQRLGSTCGGFVYSEGCVNGHAEGYAICGAPIVTVKPAACAVLHRVKGKINRGWWL